MLTEDALNLLDLVRSPSTGDDELTPAGERLLASAQHSSLAEVNQTLRILAQGISLPDPVRAAFLALVCGALLEIGGPTRHIAAPLTERLTELLQSAAAFANAARARLPSDEVEEDADDELSAFELVCDQLALTMPAEAAGWGALNLFWRPAVALYSRDPAARAAAQSLRPLTAAIEEFHEAGQWLSMLLHVLDQEPVVVLEPSTGLGIVGTMSGIVDNYQLHTLLMDVFPRTGLHMGGRVSKRVAQVARGQGLQQTNDTVIGAWNLYNWEALRPDLTLPGPGMDEGSTHWIWGEGNPEDIALFEGNRVVLLGPPSYERSWRSQRMFSGLPADITVERKLGNDEVRSWLERIAATPR